MSGVCVRSFVHAFSSDFAGVVWNPSVLVNLVLSVVSDQMLHRDPIYGHSEYAHLLHLANLPQILPVLWNFDEPRDFAHRITILVVGYPMIGHPVAEWGVGR